MVESWPDSVPSLIVSVRSPSAFPELACRLMVTPFMLTFSVHLTARSEAAAPSAADKSCDGARAGTVVLVVLAGVVVVVGPGRVVLGPVVLGPVVLGPVVVDVVPFGGVVVPEAGVVEVVVGLVGVVVAPAGSAVPPSTIELVTAPRINIGDFVR